MPKRKLTPEEESDIEDEEFWENADEEYEKTHPSETEEETETDTEESEPITDEQAREAWEKDLRDTKEGEILESKIEILESIKKRLENDSKYDEEYNKELAEIKALAQELRLKAEWSALLSNELWEKILRSYVGVINGLKNGMAQKGVITITESNGNMHISYRFFDSKGRPVLTELDDKIEGKE